MTRAVLLCVVTAAACGSAGRDAPPAATVAAAPALPGEKLVARLVERVADAHTTGPPLPEAWTALRDHPQRSLLPYARASGEAAWRAVEIAFADADVEDYAVAGEPAARRHRVRSLDPVWNRTRAVYQSRQALFVPSGGTQTQRLAVPAAAHLDTAFGALLPAGAAAATLTLRILVDGKSVGATRAIGRGGGETWFPVSVDLGAHAGHTVDVTFAVDGPAGAAGCFADPILWQRGGGAPGPNVLVVLIDTLRADAVAVMPRLRELASRGARFDQAITAATWTRPSLLALYGGDLPTAVGQPAERMIPDDLDRRRFYRLGPPLLQRLVARRGWLADAIGNNFFFLAYPAIGLDMGFESVDDVRHPVLDTPATTRAALRFFDENRDRAWLLHLHYDAPHWPYTPPPEYLARIPGDVGDPALRRDPLWRRYLAEAAYADDYLGRVLDGLRERGLDQRTLVVVLGDHGEIFDPKHGYDVEALRLPTLHHHGWTAYDEILRVPLVVVYPPAIRPTVVSAQVRTLDLARTIADYLGIDPGELPSRGQSLRPLIEGRDHADRVAFAEGQDVRAVRDGGWKYLARDDGRLKVDGRTRVITEELYDLTRDPAEHHDLVDAAPVELARMRAILAREAPTAPEAPALTYHIRVAPDVRPHRVTGTVSVGEGGIAVRGVSSGSVVPIDGRTVRLDLPAGAGCDLAVDPPEAPIDLSLSRDGLPLPSSRVLVGQFALPLIDGPLAGARLARLDAPVAPEPGNRGDVLLWRDPGAATTAPTLPRTAGAVDEVSSMMQRWGYAQPGTAPK